MTSDRNPNPDHNGSRAVFLLSPRNRHQKEDDQRIPSTALFGAGCFWGTESVFRRVSGVLDTLVGYCGGHVPDPTYDQVASGLTGHAQAVLIAYEPDRLSYDDLLDLFWRIHDPTDDQGGRASSPYRSVIFYLDESQRRAAEASRDRQQASGVHGGIIVTDIVPAGPFYPAEYHHQRYYEKRAQAVKGLFSG
jgi:peptide-methionine (S)-S-oxide reductase